MTSRDITLVVGVSVVLLLAGAGYLVLGSASPMPVVIWAAALIFAAVFLRVAVMFILDLVQYAAEGWNFDSRPPRADMRWGKGGRGRKLAPRTIMWFGYPAFVLASGLAMAVLGGQPLGYLHIFY